MRLRKIKLSKSIVLGLAMLLVISVIFPTQLASKINRALFARAMSVGDSGSISPGSPQTSTSGIDHYAFKEPPIRVSLYRGKEGQLAMEGGVNGIREKMWWGFPRGITGSVHFLNAAAFDSIGSRSVSIGKANTSSGTLDYLSDADAISNIVRMGSTCNSGGVFYDTIKQYGIESYRDGGWRTTQNWRYDESLGAWSYILRNDGGTYSVTPRLDEMFNPQHLDYDNLAQYSQDQITDLQMHYLDLLLTMYSVAQGQTKEEWGTAIDDYLNGENLAERPVTVDIDCESLINVAQSYFILLPVIDYFNFFLGIGPTYAIDGESWWSGAVPQSYWFKDDAYEQLRESAQQSINTWPDFARISDYYNGGNKFSFISTAYSKGVLSTGGGTAVWGAPDHTLTDYFNIFYLDPKTSTGEQYGYMLVPSPIGEPTMTYGSLKAEPDNKVIETSTIGMPVNLEVSSGMTDKDFGKWDKIIADATAKGWNFQVDLLISRTSADVTNPINVANNPSKFTWSPAELSAFVHGQKTIPAIDDVSAITTAGKKSITFNYKMDMNIYLNTRKYTGTAEDPASFKIIPPRIGYDSKPEAYSELKNYGESSNLSGTLKEDYEAMAGVPSTEQLYFAAGGSEFIVGITVERIEDEVSKRTYHSSYTGTDCEFKDKDTAKTKTFPSPGGGGSGNVTWDPHAGGSFTVTWTGSIPNDASSVTALHNASCPAQPNWTEYNAKKAAAQAYVAAVNGTTFDWTAGSDGRTRTKTAWGASITTDSKSPPQSTSAHESCSKAPGKPPTPCGNEMATADPDGPGNFTISVTWSIPAHIICGPCCSHVLPAINDTWAQTWTYDAMKITDVHVWTIDQAAVNGLKKIISTDVVGADIVKGRPNIFYNIALKNDPNFVAQDGSGGATGSSRAGRVRYSLDPVQHDEVIYSNGTRTNKCDGLSTTYSPNVSANGGAGHGQPYATGITYNGFLPGSSTNGATSLIGQLDYPTDTVGYLQAHTDAKDKSTVEYNKFLSQRNAQVTPTMITDFLILQTSSGDQAVMYFHKSTAPVTAETKMNQLDITKEEMWDNNSNCASKWSEDHINVGSYNGDYRNPDDKFTVNSKGNAPTTFFDPDPAATIKRPVRPSNLMLYKGALNIILQDKNKSYTTGKAEVYWCNTLHWTDVSSDRFASVTNPLSTALFPTDMKVGKITGYDFASHNTTCDSVDGAVPGGYIKHAPYSKSHNKINDIIVHDPVSTQDFSLVSLPKERDQRTGDILGGAEAMKDGLNSVKVCPRTPALCDFRVLNCTYSKDTVLADFDFSTVDEAGRPLNKVTKNALILPTGFSLSGGALQANGTRLSIPFSELNLQYQSSTKLRVEADVTMSAPVGHGAMIFSFQQYDLYIPDGQQYMTLNTGNGWERKITKPIADGVKHHLVVEFNFNSIDRCKVTIDGVEGYTRENASNDITSQLVGSNLYIGSWGANNYYPAGFIMDNLKVTRLAGTTYHTEDCYKMTMAHPNGLNQHQHSAACLDGGNGSTGAQWFVNGMSNGTITDIQARDILGNAYDPIMANSFGPVIHTWNNWSSGNMQGFNAVNQCSIDGNVNLNMNSWGGDPIFNVPVNFKASGVSKIAVTLDNNTAATDAQLFWSREDSAGYSEAKSVHATMKANTANQVVNFVVRNNLEWKNAIDSLRFDMLDRSGTVSIKNIQVYGPGTRTSAGSTGSGTVVWESGSPGSYNYSAPAGTYTLQTWGARGGTAGGDDFANKGAYASTTVSLNQQSTVYINIGGVGSNSTTNIDGQDANIYSGGFNGGAYGSGTAGSGGGGATDMRLNSNNVVYSGNWDNLLLISGGGAGAGNNASASYGRGDVGDNTSGVHLNGQSGDLARHASKYENDEGGGGGGYWGGSTIHGDDSRTGYGGTSHINAGWGGTVISGNSTMPSPYGGDEIGHVGNGYARVISNFSPVVISGGATSGVAEGQVMGYGYNGGTQQITLPAGDYKVETWGAQGGGGPTSYGSAATSFLWHNSYHNVDSWYNSPTGHEDDYCPNHASYYTGTSNGSTVTNAGSLGGKGGYSSGSMHLDSAQTVYINAGGQGGYSSALNTGGGFNGGGNGGPGGYGGGGATDIRVGGNALGNRLIVAGGGGGSDDGQTGTLGTANDGSGGEGGGLSGGEAFIDGYRTSGTAASQWGGYTAGQGQSATISNDTGGAGGGYYGGNVTNNYNGGGGGGSGYVGGVSNGSTVIGSSSMPSPYGGSQIGQQGSGYARITATYVRPQVLLSVNDIKTYWNLLPDKLPNGANNPIWGCNRAFNIHVCDSACGYVKTLQCSEPHHKGMHYDVSDSTCWAACNNDENHKKYKATINAADGSFTPGNFVNMDYGFRIYFPNQGDFDDGEPYGIGSLTSQRGLGFEDSMDTTKWTRKKRVRFEYNVIYNNKLYKAGEWITLGDRGTYPTSMAGKKYTESKWSNYGKQIYDDVEKEYYDFYCVLANYEAKSASIDAEVEAVNCPGANDNPNEITNKDRGHYTSLHGGSNTTYADVVGRIGNLTIEDTGDYRFSNLFKTPMQNTTAPIPAKYTTNDSLTTYGDATSSNGKILTTGLGNGATVKDVQVKTGAYRIDVIGTSLNNGKLNVVTAPTGGLSSENWSSSEFIKEVTATSNKMSYYLTVPSDINTNISWLGANTSAMEVSSITVTRLGASADKWVVDGVVHEVDEGDQNYYMTWSKDIRGLTIDNSTNYVNTYSVLNWVDANRIQMPVSADKNNIQILRDQPLLVGYPIYFDISSLGNYWWNNSSKIQAVPYYYALNVKTQKIDAVDAYFKYDEEYKPVNINGLVTPNWDGKGVYNYAISLDWLGESKRRNYTDIEKSHTDFFRDFYAEGQAGSTPSGADSSAGDASLTKVITPKQLDAPSGSKYILGNGQMLQASGKARTFVGGETTYNKLMNLGGSNTITTDSNGSKYNKEGRIPDYLWWQSAQRWHLKIAVPSSTVFIPKGQTPDSNNIKLYTNTDYLILCAADIRVIGDTYVLKYTQSTDNGSINVLKEDGSWTGEIKMPNNIPPVLAVYSTVKTSKYDVDIKVNH